MRARCRPVRFGPLTVLIICAILFGVLLRQPILLSLLLTLYWLPEVSPLIHYNIILIVINSRINANNFGCCYCISESSRFSEAVNGQKLRDAMKLEIDSLGQNGTWQITHLPLRKRALGSKWVYRIKYKTDGNVERYKARRVVLGNTQREGIDFIDTFASVAKMVTVYKLLCCLCKKLGYASNGRPQYFSLWCLTRRSLYVILDRIPDFWPSQSLSIVEIFIWSSPS